MNMGTRFICTQEAFVHSNIKLSIVNATENDTTLIMRTLKNTERVFNNSMAKKVQKIESKEPGNIMAIRNMVRGENYRKSFQETGDSNSVWSCGQSVGLINDIPTVQELINNIIHTACNI